MIGLLENSIADREMGIIEKKKSTNFDVKIWQFISRCVLLESLSSVINLEVQNHLATLQILISKLIQRFNSKEDNSRQKTETTEDNQSTVFVRKEFTKSLEEEETLFECNDCSVTKSFKFKEYQRHCRVKHQRKISSKDVTIQKERHRCLLPKQQNSKFKCFASVLRSDITRHIKKLHNLSPPNPNMQFKGFYTTNAGLEYTVCWSRLKDQDPPSVQMIAVNVEENLNANEVIVQPLVDDNANSELEENQNVAINPQLGQAPISLTSTVGIDDHAMDDRELENNQEQEKRDIESGSFCSTEGLEDRQLEQEINNQDINKQEEDPILMGIDPNMNCSDDVDETEKVVKHEVIDSISLSLDLNTESLDLGDIGESSFGESILHSHDSSDNGKKPKKPKVKVFIDEEDIDDQFVPCFHLSEDLRNAL